MEAVILAGGRGTRLQPYTSDIPKPLVPIGERPVIEILLGQLRRAGVTKVHVAVNHLAHLVMALLGDGKGLGLEIRYAVEDRPLSTVAPIARITDLPEQFLVANGDIITDLDVAALYRFHSERKPLVTVATYRRAERIDYGVLTADAGGRVIGFQEKPTLDCLVSMGIYVFSRDVLALVPKDEPFGFDDLMLKLLAEDRPVCSFGHDGYWLDIGRPGDYEQALADLPRIRTFL